jgi:polyphosphate kinase
MRKPATNNSGTFLNRDLSWLQFNRRVLEEAQDESNPLLERVKMLAISGSNLDEFFEIRVATLMQLIEDGSTDAGPDGMRPAVVIHEVARETYQLVEDQYRCWNEMLRPQLAENGIVLRGLEEVDEESGEFLADYFDRELDPLLTPVTIDPAHPFPRVINKSLCLGFLLRRRRRSATTLLGVTTVPRALPPLVELPKRNRITEYVFTSDLVAHYAQRMYRGYEVLSRAAFRITRNSNLYVDEESRNLLESVRTELHNRRKGAAVRLEIAADGDQAISERLQQNFALGYWQVFRARGPVGLPSLMKLYEIDRPDLKYTPFTPPELVLPRGSQSLFEHIDRGDILVHSPFDSYDTVVAFLEAAGDDPQVLSISQTLYRTGENSPMIDALVRAASRKEVTVVVELKARFDEAANIRWARHLEDAGVQVFYGAVGLKTHCKLTLLARRSDAGEPRFYAHLGTGNYNPTTARMYTDLSLLTSDPQITTAVRDVFRFLTAYSEQQQYGPLLVAPVNLAKRVQELIAREAEHARSGKPARIVMKMNALLDPEIIEELYEASNAGVAIDLIVRGMCALRPGLRNISSRIRVRSVVGRFLEHSRIFCFENGGNPEVYLGSADLMPRNLYERVEVVFPVNDPQLRDRIRYEILDTYLADTSKARLLQPDGTYVRSRRTRATARFTAQQFFIDLAEGLATPSEIGKNKKPSRAPRSVRVRIA